MSEVKLMPCPFCSSEAMHSGCDEHGYAVTCTNHECYAYNKAWPPTRELAITAWNTRANLAERDAEIAELRARAERLQDELDNKWAEGVHTCGDHCQRHMCVMRRSVDHLAEACDRLIAKWDRQADEHGVRQFTGNDHRLFANELRAVLAREPQG